MYGLWAPDVFVRIQEDATGNYSPTLYEQLLLEPNRRLAAAFPRTMIHLHNSSLFLLDLFLQIEEIECFQVNMDTTRHDLGSGNSLSKKKSNSGALPFIERQLQSR